MDPSLTRQPPVKIVSKNLDEEMKRGKKVFDCVESFEIPPSFRKVTPLHVLLDGIIVARSLVG